MPVIESAVQPTVFLTGAAGALGQAVARQFAADGARLALVDRIEGRLAVALPELDERRGHLRLAADVTDEATLQTAVERALVAFGRIDVLVHTAGGFEMGASVDATARATWDRMLELNAWSFIAVTRHVVPVMRRQRSGCIVAVSAAAAARGQAAMGAYGAAKSALQRLVEALAAELGNDGIRVNSVAPTIIDTPANRVAMPDADRSRWVPPEAIARTMAFLASPEGVWIRGQHLVLGG